MIVATGEPATEKSKSVRTALSTSGVSNNNLFVKGTNRALLNGHRYSPFHMESRIHPLGIKEKVKQICSILKNFP